MVSEMWTVFRPHFWCQKPTPSLPFSVPLRVYFLSRKWTFKRSSLSGMHSVAGSVVSLKPQRALKRWSHFFSDISARASGSRADVQFGVAPLSWAFWFVNILKDGARPWTSFCVWIQFTRRKWRLAREKRINDGSGDWLYCSEEVPKKRQRMSQYIDRK